MDRPHRSYRQIHQFFRVCSLQYAFQRLWGLAPAFVPESLPLGSALHRTAEYFWARRKEGADASEEELAALFGHLWQRELQATPNVRFTKADAESLLAQGQEMIRIYRRSVPADVQIVDINVPFRVPLIDRDGAVLESPLVGEFDLLVQHGDRLCIVDLKTASKRYSEAKLAADLQPTCYLYALRVLRPDAEAFFRWDVLVKTKTPVLVSYPIERSEPDFWRLAELVKRMEAMIAAGHFVPNDGSMYCARCGYQGLCRQWPQVSLEAQACRSEAACT